LKDTKTDLVGDSTDTSRHGMVLRSALTGTRRRKKKETVVNNRGLLIYRGEKTLRRCVGDPNKKGTNERNPRTETGVERRGHTLVVKSPRTGGRGGFPLGRKRGRRA